MKSNRVEQHIINNNDEIYNIIDELCFRSKNVYNRANYIIRQEFINNGKWIRYNELDKIMQQEDCYYELGSQCSQNTLKLLDKNWKASFNSIADWKKHPDKYLGRPRLPKYKHKDNGRFILMVKNIQCKIEDGYLKFSWKPLKPLNNRFRTNATGKLMQVRFIPRNKSYVMEIVYEIDVQEPKEESHRIIGIDIGVDNLATVGNNVGLQPYIINGRPLKSINQYYNKTRAEKQSDLKKRHDKNWSNSLQKLTDKRNNKVNDYIHKASKYIVDWCVQNDIDTIVIGKNKNWKQESELSKKVNQNFVGIPHDLFIQKIKYKAENNGIKVIETEESYTSGTSFLDGEEPCQENYDITRRKTRGLFRSNEGVVIHADLNGSYQIIKKVFPNAFADGIEGVGLHPVRVNF